MTTLRYDGNGTPGELRPLWEEAFGGDEKSLSWFLRAALSADGLPCLRKEHEVVAAFLRFDMAFGAVRGAYVYGLCTKADERGHGCMRTLLDAASDAAAKEGLGFLMLIPATPALRETYCRLGFMPWGRLGTRTDERGRFVPALTLAPGYTAEEDPAALSELFPQNGLSDEAFRLALDSMDGLVPVRIGKQSDPAGRATAAALRGEGGRFFLSSIPACLAGEGDTALVRPLSEAASAYFSLSSETTPVEPLPR